MVPLKSIPTTDFSKVSAPNSNSEISPINIGPSVKTPQQEYEEAILPVGFFNSVGIGFSNAADKALESNFVLKNIFGDPLEEAARGKKSSANELNARYPQMEVPFSEGMYDLQAEMIYERQLEKQRRNAALSGSSFVGSQVGGMAGWMSDPVNFASAWLGGEVVKGLGSLMAGTESMGTVGKFILNDSAFKSRYIKEALGGALGGIPSAVSEYQFDKESQQDASVWEAFKNVALGAIVGPIVGEGLRFGIGNAKAMPSYIGAYSEGGFRGVSRAFKEANIQINLGKKVDLSAVSKENKIPNSGRGPEEGKLYAAQSEPHTDSEILGGKDLGDGLYLSSDPDIVNNHISHPEREQMGQMVEYSYNPKELKLADMSGEKLQEELQAAKKDIRRGYEDQKDALQTKFETLKSEGYDGIRIKNEDGSEYIKLFKKDNPKIKPESVMDADINESIKSTESAREEAQKAAQDTFDKIQREDSNEFVEADEQKAFFDEVEKAGTSKKEVQKPEEIHAEVLETIKGLKDKEGIDPSIASALESIQKDANNIEKKNDIIKAAAYCMRL